MSLPTKDIPILFIMALLMCFRFIPAHGADSSQLVAGVEWEADSTVRESWWQALKRGYVNPHDSTLNYPHGLRWTWDAVGNASHWLNPYDTAWVASTGKHFKVTIKNNNWFDDYDFRDEDMKVLFHSHASSNLGASLSAYGISVGYSVSLDRLRGHDRRSSKLELGFNCARFAIEFYRMTNVGDMTMTFDLGKHDRFHWSDFSGIKRKSWGLNSYYYFNNRHYAPSAAYGFSKVQRRNAGSFLAGVGVSHRNFTIRLQDIPEVLRDEEFKEEYGDQEEEAVFDYTDGSVIGGYGFNWVLGRRWLINVTGMLYSGIKHAHAKSTSDGGHTFWALNGKGRMGISYNPGHVFCGLQGQIDSHFFNTGDYRFHSNIYDFTLVVGVQF